MTRVPPTGKTREALRALFEEGTAGQDPKGELMRLAMRLIVEEALACDPRPAVFMVGTVRGISTCNQDFYPSRAFLVAWLLPAT